MLPLCEKCSKISGVGQNYCQIETRASIENIESIIEEADAVMIARGDLAIETLPESVPIDQRNIIGLGLRHRKPTIVATQMLASMTETPEPTRAEVSDVATAVIVGADAVMLRMKQLVESTLLKLLSNEEGYYIHTAKFCCSHNFQHTKNTQDKVQSATQLN